MSRYKCMTYPDLNNGPGCRVSIFFTGCPIHCPGCFNSQLWDFNAGHEFTDETYQKLKKILLLPYISGLTILGGEPMAQDPKVIQKLVKLVKDHNKTVWLYTGYNYDDFTDEQKATLKGVDVVVDGPFEKDKASSDLKFRGSSNQRIIEL